MPKRVAIPNTLAARILFESDRTCCVCKQKGKPVQIHHIDGDHSNSIYGNLAVLCLDCHTQTQIKGGFHRKLDSDQIILYHRDWCAIVSRDRAQQKALQATEDGNLSIGHLIEFIEKLKMRKSYRELIFVFHNLKEIELRDKYIELHLKRSSAFEDQFYFRAMQKRTDLLPKKQLEEYFRDLESSESWQDLSSAYFGIGDLVNGAKYLCMQISSSISDSNYFNAAFCLRSLPLNVQPSDLFEKALDASRGKKDIFWELRSLQELGWIEELKRVMKEKENEIEEARKSRPFDMFDGIV